MFSPLVLWRAKIHREALLEEAQRRRIAARSRACVPRFEVRVLVGLGVFLISMGLRLHERHLPKMRPVPESCSPACG